MDPRTGEMLPQGGMPTVRRGRPPGVGSVRPNGYVYDRAPMLVYWELTRACGLACRHCRAEAIQARSPLELDTEQGLALLAGITGFGRPYPHIVFTGGDPLRRPDLGVFVREATRLGIGSSLAPSATGDLTSSVLEELHKAGIQAISLSLDGSNPERHDDFRGVGGTFETTIAAAALAGELGLPLQINTLVTNETLDDLPAIYELLTGLKIMRWSLFFLISVGRGTALQEITPGQSERLFHQLYDLTARSPFAIKTTEAMHYRRVAIGRMTAEGLDAAAIAATSVGRGFGVRDGNGVMFIGHDGTVTPSGFVPLSCGNVNTEELVTIYRNSDTLRHLRDVTTFLGRCGRCEYATVCGGSRARAFAWTGNVLESDPLCPYVPPSHDPARGPVPQVFAS
jgi:radical SAM protein